MRAGRKPTADWTGDVLLGKWTVERLIGVGGTSTVLQARHRNGRRAALKVLHQHLAAHPRTQQRFLREGRLANLVDHPGVVAVLDDFSAGGTAVLVLELVQGENLAARAAACGGRLDQQEVIAAACAVLDVLTVAHDANVVHRDIKPENILLCRKGTYKLADFGLAGLCDELGELTGNNVALGTPAYMSPEQARGDVRQIDARTDLWGVGATMFRLLTGRFVHDAGSARNLVVAAATEPAPSVRALEPAIQPELAEIVDRAVQMNKADRWPDARSMRSALDAVGVQNTRAGTPISAPKTVTSIATLPSSVPKRVALKSASRGVWVLLGAACLTSVGSSAAVRERPDASAQLRGVLRVPTWQPASSAVSKPDWQGADSPGAAVSAPQRATHSTFEGRPASRLKPTASLRRRSPSAPKPPAVPTPVRSSLAQAEGADLYVPEEVLDRRE